MTMIILFGTLLVLVAISVPIGIAIGLASMLTIYLSGSINISMLIQKLFTSLDSFPLLAIPFFMLAGLLMGRGGISQRILVLANQLVGWMAGGLAMVTIVACTFFAALSGSGPATVAAIGSFMIPEMKQRNYDSGFASALTAAAGSIGVLIPPSIPFILYGVISGTSIGELFKAGILPGLLIGVVLMVVSTFILKKDNKNGKKIIRDEVDYSFKQLLKATWDAKWALLAPVIILGGIYGGVFTPTEAAVVGIVYSLLIGVFIHKDLKWKQIHESLIETLTLTGATMYMIGTSIAFAYMISTEQIPMKIADFITSLTSSEIVILLLINIILLIAGAFIDTIPALAMLTPILLPIATEIGVDPIHFGVIMVMNLSLGFITPPFGVNLFIASSVGKVPIEKMFKSMVPIILFMISALLIVTFIPTISLLFTK